MEYTYTGGEIEFGQCRIKMKMLPVGKFSNEVTLHKLEVFFIQQRKMLDNKERWSYYG